MAEARGQTRRRRSPGTKRLGQQHVELHSTFHDASACGDKSRRTRRKLLDISGGDVRSYTRKRDATNVRLTPDTDYNSNTSARAEEFTKMFVRFAKTNVMESIADAQQQQQNLESRVERAERAGQSSLQSARTRATSAQNSGDEANDSPAKGSKGSKGSLRKKRKRLEKSLLDSEETASIMDDNFNRTITSEPFSTNETKHLLQPSTALRLATTCPTTMVPMVETEDTAPWLWRKSPTMSRFSRLDGRTIHSLYAFSFVIYTMSTLCDWVHVCMACRGYTLSFTVQPWFVISMVSICMMATILTIVLLVLCIEHAFVSKVPWDPFASGFELIFDEFTTWLLNFNCFRVSFLVLIFHNLPMTFCNFWFISSCRVASAQLPLWPLFLSGVSTCISLIWRLVMLYYAYRHFWFFKMGKQQLTALNRESSTIDELKTKVGLTNKERLSEYDECWPVRYSYQRTYMRRSGEMYDEDLTTTSLSEGEEEAEDEEGEGRTPRRRPSANRPLLRRILSRLRKVCLCTCLTSALYALMCLVCCLPCIWHYACRRQSLIHRNRFAKTCTRITSTGFHMFVLLFALITTLTLLFINCVWLSSVHVIGVHRIPPELNHLCISLDLTNRVIYPHLFDRNIRHTNATHHLECVPVYDRWMRSENPAVPKNEARWQFGFTRCKADPWMLRKVYNSQLLTIWSHMDLPWSANSSHPPSLELDFTLKSGVRNCGSRQNGTTGWVVDTSAMDYDHGNHGNYHLANQGRMSYMPFPYFAACMNTMSIKYASRLSCVDPMPMIETNVVAHQSGGRRRRKS